MQAFNTLSGSRAIGMGLGSIPVSEILTYLNWQDIRGDEAERWLHLIRHLDAAYLAETGTKDDDGKQRNPN